MKIRKFTAPSVPLALRQVHDDLGNRAVILNTRTLPPGGDPAGRVEVTAAIDEDVLAGATSVSAGAPVATRQVASRPMAAAASAAHAPRADLLGRVYGRSRPGVVADTEPGAEPRPRWQQSAERPQVEERHIRSAADWLASLPAVGHERRQDVGDDAETASSTAPAADPISPAEPNLQRELDESVVVGQLRQLEEAIHRMASQAGGFELPVQLSRLGERLRRTGLTDAHVQRCQQVIMGALNQEQLEDQAAVASKACECLADMLPGNKEIRVGRERRVVALVGPSGSGKTTAAARIAAGFVRRRQQRGAVRHGEVVLISADARRVGALAQAQAFAELIHVPLETAYEAAEMGSAVDAHPQARLILIDVGGCGPHERSESEHQRRLLDAGGVDEVHVVVDGLTGADHILETARSWQRHDGAGIRLMVTKMDQSVRPGAIVSAAIDADLPLSYVTTSAAVPGGIRPGDLMPWIEWMVGVSPRPFTESDA